MMATVKYMTAMMLAGFGAGCGDNLDETPPELVWSSLEGGPLWLHDRLWFQFSEGVDYAAWEQHARIERADGSPLAIRHWWFRDNPELVAIEVDYAEAAAGSLLVHLDGVVDLAGNELEATRVEWSLDEWTVDNGGLDHGQQVGPPSIVAMRGVGGETTSTVATVWTAGDAASRVVTGAYRHGGWIDMGETDSDGGIEIDAAPVDYELHVVGAVSTKWWGTWGYGEIWSATRIDSSPGHFRYGAVERVFGGVAVELGESWDDEDVVLEPDIATVDDVLVFDIAMPSEEAPVVALVERRLGDQDLLRVVVRTGEGWAEWGSLLIRDPVGAISVVADSDEVHVGWDDGTRIHLARASPTGLEELVLEVPLGSTQIRLEVDIDGQLVAVWIETSAGGSVGRIARWDGVVWDELATPWARDEIVLDEPAVTLWNGRVPAVAWREGGNSDDSTVRVALYNGPVD